MILGGDNMDTAWTGSDIPGYGYNKSSVVDHLRCNTV